MINAGTQLLSPYQTNRHQDAYSTPVDIAMHLHSEFSPFIPEASNQVFAEKSIYRPFPDFSWVEKYDNSSSLANNNKEYFKACQETDINTDYENFAGNKFLLTRDLPLPTAPLSQHHDISYWSKFPEYSLTSLNQENTQSTFNIVTEQRPDYTKSSPLPTPSKRRPIVRTHDCGKPAVDFYSTGPSSGHGYGTFTRQNRSAQNGQQCNPWQMAIANQRLRATPMTGAPPLANTQNGTCFTTNSETFVLPSYEDSIIANKRAEQQWKSCLHQNNDSGIDSFSMSQLQKSLDSHYSQDYAFHDSVSAPLSRHDVAAVTDVNWQMCTREEKYSRKVFIGGLPPDIDEDKIVAAFRCCGVLTVDWPHKSESKSFFPPKGYCFLLFQSEASVQALINMCIHDDGKCYWYVSSPTVKDKQVQIRPWDLRDADFVLDGSKLLDPRKTIFVGGVPRPLRAEELAVIMEELYGGVCYAGIDTDPELKYPKGAGRVAFSNHQSYIAAISARFVQLRHGDIDKRVEVKPYVLDDQFCDECFGSRCGGKFAPFFCANVACLKYYCEYCWAQIHALKPLHKPLVKEGADRPRTVPFRW